MLQIRHGHIRRILCRSSHDRHHQRVLQFAAPLIWGVRLFGACQRFWRIVALGDVGKQGFVAFLELCGTCLVAILVIRLCVLCQHQGASVNAEGTVEQEARCWWSWLRCICYLTSPSKLFFSPSYHCKAASLCSFVITLSWWCLFLSNKFIGGILFFVFSTIIPSLVSPQLPGHKEWSPNAHAFYRTNRRFIPSFTTEIYIDGTPLCSCICPL